MKNGYATIARRWKKGDAVELNLPMPVRRVLANEKVTEDAGKVAFQRGPLVFCAEWPDLKDGHVVNLVVPKETRLVPEFRPDLLNGVEVRR